MRNIAMLVSYDGTNYEGFQTQPGGNTIQDKLEEAIERLTGERTKIIGSGRTDAGVHAYGQVINFTTASRIPIERWSLAMNARLPHDILVRGAVEVPFDFHSRKSAIGKTYRYTIQNSKLPDVFNRGYQLHHPRPLNIAAMREALTFLIGEHDYTSYCSPKAPGDHRVRTIYAAEIFVEDGTAQGLESASRSPMANFPRAHDLFKLGANSEEVGRCVHIYITGNGFLYNMVRIIVGTLLLVGQNKLEAADMLKILEGRDRSLAGPTAVAHGLSLWKVYYADPDLQLQ